MRRSASEQYVVLGETTLVHPFAGEGWHLLTEIELVVGLGHSEPPLPPKSTNSGHPGRTVERTLSSIHLTPSGPSCGHPPNSGQCLGFKLWAKDLGHSSQLWE